MSAGIELGEEELDLVAGGGKGSKGNADAKIEYLQIDFEELIVNSIHRID
jgi:hypothetical protein